ncbi:hypothetical protein DdX_18653 [Ditylenchus destructor]|uniref:Uncharacterized protein n=1 Tax=Ditylenchus destructor TaxID=166010 RepID=A0AAD4MJB1_9BILA|nr:hypothetical protein DdX_18653 [Ditylenchus destructor]
MYSYSSTESMQELKERLKEIGSSDSPAGREKNNTVVFSATSEALQINMFPTIRYTHLRIAGEPPMFCLCTHNNEITQADSWSDLKEKLRDYHDPLDEVIVQETIFNEQITNFFRAIDSNCFTSRICFNRIDFSNASEITFLELFQRRLRPKWIQFDGIRGISCELFAVALSTNAMFDSIVEMKIIDTLNVADPSFKVRKNFILRFLHSGDDKNVTKKLTIQTSFLTVSINEIFDELFQVFESNTERSTYSLQIYCPVGFTLPDEIRLRNRISNERLELTVELVVGEYRILSPFAKEFTQPGFHVNINCY